MKKRKKKFNAVKSASIGARVGLKDLAVWFSLAHSDKCDLIDYRRFKSVSVTPSIATAISSWRYKWTVYMFAFGRTQSGQEYMKTNQLECSNEYYQSDLVDVLNDEHKAFVAKEVPDAQLCNVGWLAIPFEVDLDEQQLGKICTKLDAWGNPAKWQWEEKVS